MYTTYHLQSAQDISTDIMEAIKTAFKNKPVVITVEEDIDETAYLQSRPANKAALDKSHKEAKAGKFIEVRLKD